MHLKLYRFATGLFIVSMLFLACSSEDSDISNNWISEDGNIRMQFTEDGETFTYFREKVDENGNQSAENGTYELSEDEKTLTTENVMGIETTYEVVELGSDKLVLKSDRDGEVTFKLEAEADNEEE